MALYKNVTIHKMAWYTKVLIIANLRDQQNPSPQQQPQDPHNNFPPGSVPTPSQQSLNLSKATVVRSHRRDPPVNGEEMTSPGS